MVIMIYKDLYVKTLTTCSYQKHRQRRRLWPDARRLVEDSKPLYRNNVTKKKMVLVKFLFFSLVKVQCFYLMLILIAELSLLKTAHFPQRLLSCILYLTLQAFKIDQCLRLGCFFLMASLYGIRSASCLQ